MREPYECWVWKLLLRVMWMEYLSVVHCEGRCGAGWWHRLLWWPFVALSWWTALPICWRPTAARPVLLRFIVTALFKEWCFTFVKLLCKTEGYRLGSCHPSRNSPSQMPRASPSWPLQTPVQSLSTQAALWGWRSLPTAHRPPSCHLWSILLTL